MSTVSSHIHLMWKIDKSMCSPKKNKVSLIVFWNIQKTLKRLKNKKIAFIEFDSIANQEVHAAIKYVFPKDKIFC